MKDLDYYGSDHKPLLILHDTNPTNKVQKRERRFYIEEKWFQDKTFFRDFLKKWKSFGNSMKWTYRMKLSQSLCTSWAGSRFDKISKQIETLREKRKMMREGNLHKENPHKVEDR